MRYVLALALVSAAAVVAAQDGAFVTYGPIDDNAASCGRWSRADTQERQVFEHWVWGFISGANYKAHQTAARTDSAAITAWLDKYCTDRPLDPFVRASMALVDELATRASK